MESPIGITFMPSAEQAAEGPRRGNLEGDLGQAFKILSLRLPRVLGAKPLASPALLNGPGSSGLPGGMNPYAAVFNALLRAGMGGGAASAPQGGGFPTPNVIPGGEERGRVYDPNSVPVPPSGPMQPMYRPNPMQDKYAFSRERDAVQGIY